AGTYLCNAAGYLASLCSSRLRVPGGFLHLPPHTDLAMRLGLPHHRPLGEIVDTVRCVAEASLGL
ncbi:MAG: pyroglutamyl-peptidase I, partial [Candidatus Korarchaeota archaeon]|nr:pyroglutamyl-peptidase I [Candidatus Korarchaeota archaeon]